MVGNLELVGLMVCQLLFVVVFIWTVIDGGFFEAKPKIVDLGRVDIDGNWEIKRVYTKAGAGGFQEVVQGSGNVPVKGSDRVDSHFQRETTAGEAAGTGTTGKESGRGVSSRALREGETGGSRYVGGHQEESGLDDGGIRKYLERRAVECGLFGSRVND